MEGTNRGHRDPLIDLIQTETTYVRHGYAEARRFLGGLDGGAEIRGLCAIGLPIVGSIKKD